jgi:hypothetical protein
MNKKIYFISYFLKKRQIEDPELIDFISKLDDDSFLPIMVLFNVGSFFGYIAWDFIEEVAENYELLKDFNLEEDLHLFRLNKKDREFVKKLYREEIIGISLFYENYLIFNLPLTLENVEFFKKHSHSKIYRYKREVQIDDLIYDVRDIIEEGDSEKLKYIEKDYRLEIGLFKQ